MRGLLVQATCVTKRPNPWTSTSTRSPLFNHTGGLRKAPTPAGVPVAIIRRLNDAVNRGIALPDIRARLVSSGLDVEPGTPEALGAYLENEIRKWSRLIRERGIKPDED